MIKGLGMGADRGLIINNEGLENLDSLVFQRYWQQHSKRKLLTLFFVADMQSTMTICMLGL